MIIVNKGKEWKQEDTQKNKLKFLKHIEEFVSK